MVFHYIYKVESDSGKYYIGRHTTKKLMDGYKGSGKWVRSIKDKSVLTKTILEYCDSFEQLKAREAELLAQHVGLPNCMNFNTNSCGFAYGVDNPAYLPHVQQQTLHRMLTNNPMLSAEVRQRASARMRERPSLHIGLVRSAEVRANISKGRTGSKMSEEGRRKLSESRKRDYATGVRVPTRAMLGVAQSAEAKAKVSAKALAREKTMCEHCGMLCTKQNLTRWHGIKCKQYGN